MSKEIKVKETTVYGPHGEVRDETILTFPSVEAFEKWRQKTDYRLGWEGGPLPDYEIINEHEQNNESNKI